MGRGKMTVYKNGIGDEILLISKDEFRAIHADTKVAHSVSTLLGAKRWIASQNGKGAKPGLWIEYLE